MAQQQVKFHSVDAASYAGITTPDNGSLYFISDNGEIRKGDKHITGTRVFTATDSTGTTPVKDLDIMIDGKSIRVKVQKKDGDEKPLYKDASGNETTSATHTEGEGDDAHEVANEKIMVMTSDLDETVEHPKRGDMLIVNSDSANPSAYVYSENGGTYDSLKWLACSGKYDASNVVITEDLKMAGNYENIGNFKKETEG